MNHLHFPGDHRVSLNKTDSYHEEKAFLSSTKILPALPIRLMPLWTTFDSFFAFFFFYFKTKQSQELTRENSYIVYFKEPQPTSVGNEIKCSIIIRRPFTFTLHSSARFVWPACRHCRFFGERKVKNASGLRVVGQAFVQFCPLHKFHSYILTLSSYKLHLRYSSLNRDAIKLLKYATFCAKK